MLLTCELPEKMKELECRLIERLGALQDCITKFGTIYQADLSQFQEYYIPEALQLTVSYLEYIDMDIDQNTITKTETEVLDAIAVSYTHLRFGSSPSFLYEWEDGGGRK